MFIMTNTECKIISQNNNNKDILNKFYNKYLKKLCKEHKIKNYSKLKRSELIALLSSNLNENIISKLNEDYPNIDATNEIKNRTKKRNRKKKKNNRSKNGSREKKRLEYLVKHYNDLLVNNPNELKKFFRKNNINDIKSFNKAGGCNKNYDITIIFKNGSSETIEHKGIKIEGKIVNNYERPWEHTPQLLNETYKFSNTNIFTKMWHTKAMPELKKKFSNLPEIPSYDVWLKQDASMGSAKSNWGKALKIISQSSKPNLIFINNIYKKYLKEYWNKISSDSKLKEELRLDLETNMSKTLKEKNHWMNCFYESPKAIKPKNIFVSKTPSILDLKIKIDLDTKKKLPKGIITYKLTSNPSKIFTGEARLRWGNGNGIANIRWNIS